MLSTPISIFITVASVFWSLFKYFFVSMLNVFSLGTPANEQLTFKNITLPCTELFVHSERQNYGVLDFILLQAPNIVELHTVPAPTS